MAEVTAAVAKAQADLAQAGGSGAFARDPYRLALASISTAIGTGPLMMQAIADIGAHTVAQIRQVVQSARQQEIVDASREGVRQASEAVAAGVVARARASDRRSLALACTGFAVALAAVGGGAFWAGQASVRTETAAMIRAERAELALAQDAISLPVQDARAWAQLIRANPSVRANLAKVERPQTSAAGQPSGLVPLWLGFAVTPSIAP